MFHLCVKPPVGDLFNLQRARHPNVMSISLRIQNSPYIYYSLSNPFKVQLKQLSPKQQLLLISPHEPKISKMSQDRTQILRELKVIPDVLPEGTTLSHDLKVVFPEVTLDTPGQELGREETQPEPRLFLDPVVCPHPILRTHEIPTNPPQPEEKHNDYVLILTDPVRTLHHHST